MANAAAAAPFHIALSLFFIIYYFPKPLQSYALFFISPSLFEIIREVLLFILFFLFIFAPK